MHNERDKISFTSTSSAEIIFKTLPATSSSLLLNSRVQTEPEVLSRLVTEAIREVEERWNARIGIKSVSAFQPGYPVPTHRDGIAFTK